MTTSSRPASRRSSTASSTRWSRAPSTRWREPGPRRTLRRRRRARRASALDFLLYFAVTRRADAVAELRVGVLGDVLFDLLPVLVVAADPLAVAADRQEPVQRLDVGQRLLQLGDPLIESILQRQDPHADVHP